MGDITFNKRYGNLQDNANAALFQGFGAATSIVGGSSLTAERAILGAPFFPPFESMVGAVGGAVASSVGSTLLANLLTKQYVGPPCL